MSKKGMYRKNITFLEQFIKSAQPKVRVEWKSDYKTAQSAAASLRAAAERLKATDKRVKVYLRGDEVFLELEFVDEESDY